MTPQLVEDTWSNTWKNKQRQDHFGDSNRWHSRRRSSRFFVTRRLIFRWHDLNDHPLSLLTVPRNSTNEVERPWLVKLVDCVACVGEEAGMTSIALLVILFSNFHNRILPVLKTCTGTPKLKNPKSKPMNFMVCVHYYICMSWGVKTYGRCLQLGTGSLRPSHCRFWCHWQEEQPSLCCHQPGTQRKRQRSIEEKRRWSLLRGAALD